MNKFFWIERIYIVYIKRRFIQTLSFLGIIIYQSFDNFNNPVEEFTEEYEIRYLNDVLLIIQVLKIASYSISSPYICVGFKSLTNTHYKYEGFARVKATICWELIGKKSYYVHEKSLR